MSGHHRPGEVPAQPFTAAAVPVSIDVPARRIAGWQKDRLDRVGLLHDGPTETVTLVPMGAARLRISRFPVVTDAADAPAWPAPPATGPDH